jgi:ABC-type branched-subunit amino acid transport system substrate-binding protein
MKTWKICFGIIGTMLLLLPLGTACVPDSSSQKANPTQGSTLVVTKPLANTQEATKPQANEVLKLGFAMDLTGPGAEWFVPFANILEMEIDRINIEGGVEVAGKKYDLKLIKYTTNLTAEGAKAAAEKLIYQDGVKVMWGAGILDETMALQDVTMPNKVLNFSAGFGQETLSGK